MSALTFTLKISPVQRVDCSPLTPEQLNGKTAAEIAALPLWSGKRQLRVDELFDISRMGDDGGDDDSEDSNDDHIVFLNSSAHLDRIGQGMRSGRITVHGDAGDYLGLELRGGTLELHGNAGHFAACAMSAGMLHIHGNSGDYLGAGLVGERKGMRGGTVLVTGNVGDRAGDQMRRGLMLIEGDAGDYCASRMLAGTLGVLGKVGRYTGYGMRRGTLLLTQTPLLHATLADCGTHTLPFLNLMFKSLRGLPSRYAQLDQNRVRRYAGDIANQGTGEILVLLPP
ncbi:formylmethanofuran dehydrogenase subunit C [Pseudomethylobacillus aquaticus]|uniref:Formylmethanofuran dehydrogenase subunit C n=1 Tax=Pseudomethylobacillus aquaticus TaxID=2676064 RepID=A0A3N0UYP4_9PROT|nr:formylmethanofuran dehydrogenase subunit C [Pseudomethylobacillus aquaticus]ROH85358.1 formylmethanofuran dehydrogenase subunit C [Pseudomethylobacillus aquaticus]